MNQDASGISGWEPFLALPILVLGAIVITRSWVGRLISAGFTRNGASRAVKVEAWAVGAGYLLTRCERRAFFRGPFKVAWYRHENVYRVTVLDADNRSHTGWVRVTDRHWRGGSQVDVRWDEVELQAQRHVLH